MILTRLKKQTGFTESEKAIAEYILNHTEEFQLLTSEALAKETLTSKSSVIRLCKKLDLSGYQELKKLIFAEKSTTPDSANIDALPALSTTSTYSDFLKALDLTYERIILKMHEQLNHNTVKRVINRLRGMEKIDFYSSGLGYSIADAAAHRYSSLGIGCTTYSSINEVFLANNKHNNKTAAFIISFSGNNPSAIHNAKTLKRYDIYTIGIVGHLSKEIEHYCDEILHIPVGEVLPGAEHASVVFAANYIFDLLFMGLLSKRYDQQIQLQKKVIYDFKKFP